MTLVKYIGEGPARYGDRLLRPGDEFEVADGEAQALAELPSFEMTTKTTTSTTSKRKRPAADEPTGQE